MRYTTFNWFRIQILSKDLHRRFVIVRYFHQQHIVYDVIRCEHCVLFWSDWSLARQQRSTYIIIIYIHRVLHIFICFVAHTSLRLSGVIVSSSIVSYILVSYTHSYSRITISTRVWGVWGQRISHHHTYIFSSYTTLLWGQRISCNIYHQYYHTLIYTYT